jgi:hypothetical protein
LGAKSLYQRGSASCYDPAFNAGYPKTPVFDSGSRPAELMLLLSGGAYCPRAYKIGLAVICAAVAWLLAVAARAIGLTWAGATVATALGLGVWWGQPCREALEAGEVDLLLATVLVVAQSGLLIRYHRAPGPCSLVGITVTGLLGWYADPLLMALLLPLFLIYYLSVGARHPLLWHVGLLGGLVLAGALNAFWLLDCLDYWWILLPLHVNAPPLAERTFPSLWDSPVWGGPTDRLLTCVLIPAAVMGLVLYNQTRQRPTARLFGTAIIGFLGLAVASLVWEPLGRFGLARLLAPGLFFSVLPATHVFLAISDGIRRRAGWGTVALLAGAAAIGLLLTGALDWRRALMAPQPFAVGLPQDQRTIVETLQANTTQDARILWEDRSAAVSSEPQTRRTTSQWTALLPLLTERSFVGGLDPDALIEHTATGLRDHSLAGRSLSDWTDTDLQAYCERYNIGWVMCWSAESAKRFAAWPFTQQIAVVRDEQEGVLYQVKRQPSFVLIGAAKWLRADSECIALDDVTPRQGQVLLSLHYQEGMRVTPSRVRVERAETLSDHIDFVRLLIPDQHVSRVTITWDKR